MALKSRLKIVSASDPLTIYFSRPTSCLKTRAIWNVCFHTRTLMLLGLKEGKNGQRSRLVSSIYWCDATFFVMLLENWHSTAASTRHFLLFTTTFVNSLYVLPINQTMATSRTWWWKLINTKVMICMSHDRNRKKMDLFLFSSYIIIYCGFCGVDLGSLSLKID